MPSQIDQPLVGEIQALLAEAIQVPVEMVTADLTFGDLPQSGFSGTYGDPDAPGGEVWCGSECRNDCPVG